MSTNEIAILNATGSEGNNRNNSSFIPISAHYDSNILITKSGDLVLTISVDGYDSDISNAQSMKNRIRDSIRKNVETYKISVHLHTVREFRNISAKGVIPFGFPAAVNSAWNKYHNWDRQLVNVLYITLIYQGPRIKPLSVAALSNKATKHKFEREWEYASKELHSVANSICDDLKSVGTRKLGISSEKNGSVSEPLSFYYYLTHFKEAKIFAPMNDLSDVLNDIDIKYGFNKIQISSNNSNSYLAVFTLKESIDTPEKLCNGILQAKTKFVISEVLIFADKVLAKKGFNQYIDVLEMGKANVLADSIGLTAAVKSDQGKIADYARYQINIIIHNEDEDSFEGNIIDISRVFRELGFVVIREDFNMAKCLWSILPGNFKFLCRENYAGINQLMNFSSLHDNNMGNNTGSKWGGVISLFKTISGSPFYFNFHNGSNGNTILIGPKCSGKTGVTQFLLAQSIKLDPAIIYIDVLGGNEGFVQKMGGEYISIAPSEDSPIKIFPFDKNIFYGDESAMKMWITEALLVKESDKNDMVKKLVDTLLENLLSLKSIDSRKKAFLGILNDMSANEDAMKIFSGIIKLETYNGLFSDSMVKCPSSGEILGISLAKIENPVMRASFLKLLLLKLSLSVNKQTIISINDATILLECQYIATLLPSMMQSIESQDSILILEAENSKSIQDNPNIYNVIKTFGTQMYMTDHLADKRFKFNYNLSDEEWKSIKAGATQLRRFLVKQGNVSVVTSFYMPQMQELLRPKGT